MTRPAKRPPSSAGPASGRPYAALARKYRPNSFAEVVGQEAVGRTLRGALREGHVPAALLFAGPRGTGKTTMARLLAMALNCSAAEAATPDPCGTCSTCAAVADGSSLDVIEVDAASHNGVDDVREIRERVAHLPASSRFKVYILDEAHMFSTAAWNAFLKTLEEPPAHARFVFATTEPEKVPDTILSRCQRYDFRRIQARDIVRTLRSIVERESEERGTPIEAGDAALAALARAAHGGLRDAESLLEQAILAGDGRVREEDLAALLGTVPREMVRAVLERAAAGDAAGTLVAYGRVHEAGGDAASFLGLALEMLRELTAVAVAGADTPVVDAEDAERASLAALARTFGASGTLRATQALAEALRLVRATDEERPLVEAGLLRVALQGSGRTIPEVLDALAAMEARLAGVGGAAPQGRAAQGQPDISPGAPPRPGAAAVPVAGTAAPLPPLLAPAPTPAGGALFGEERPQRPGPNAGDASAVLTLDRVKQDWPRVLEEAKGRAPTLATFLAPARPLVLAEDSLTLAFPSNMAFHRSQCEDEGRRKALDEVLSLVFGRRLRPIFETSAEEAGPAKPAPGEGPEAAPPEAKEFDRLRTEEIEALQKAPAVRALEKEFKVKMVKVGRRRGAEAAGAAGEAAGEAEGTEERE